MRIPNLRHITAFSLVAALLAVGGMACLFSGADDEAAAAEITKRLDEVDERSTDNLIKMELLTADVTRLKESNLELTGRVDQLQQEKEAQAALIEGLKTQVAVGAIGGAAAIITDPAAMDDAAVLKRYAECAAQQAGGIIPIPASVIEQSLSDDITEGVTSYEQLRASLAEVCSGQ